MIDLEELRQAIRIMNNRGNHTALYKLLKEELSARGWWKNRRRGRPTIGKK